jgi:23S rRNA (guanosine2251-2'-O)-methyltransferase
VAGRRPVEEAFVARREARRLLVVPQRRQALEKIVLHATSLRIPIVEVEGGSLTALAGFDGHQGVALVVAPRRYAQVDDILARAIERHEPAFVLVLDSLEDPQNVGTLLRSAEAAGTHGVVFPTHHQAPLTPSAIKASAGAVEHLLLAPVDDLAGALADLHGRGLRIVGADADAPLVVRDADLRGPMALVVGSEGQGLGPAVRRRCDLLVRIPMRGAVGSLNASVAGSILLYEATTQRGGASAAPEPGPEPAPADVPVAQPDLPAPTEPTDLTDPTESVGEPAAAGPKGTRQRATRTARPAVGSPAVAPVEPSPKPVRRRSKAATGSAEPPPGSTEPIPAIESSTPDAVLPDEPRPRAPRSPRARRG